MIQEFVAKATEQVEEAVKEYEETPKPTIDDMFNYTIAKIGQAQQKQLEYLRQFEKKEEEK